MNSANLVFELNQIHGAVVKQVDSALSYHGLSFTEFTIMHYLFNSALNTMRRIELAQHVGITASGVTRLLAPMEKNRIVQKEINPNDARQSLVKLSSSGERLYKEALVSFKDCSSDLFARLSDRDKKTIETIKHKILY